MENLDEIKGYIIYREESQEELEKQRQEEQKVKDLINQNKGESGEVPKADSEDDSMVDEKTASIIKKFKNKILREFIPHFVLNQYKDDPAMEYQTFTQCVDEYFSQS